jgi:hypothetical protein
MIRPFRAIVSAAAVVVLLIAVGRWEQRRQIDDQIAGMQAVIAAIGPLDHVGATGYRFGPPDCLAYPIATNTLGLQICFDRRGHVVETVDRRGSQPVYASLAYDPGLSRLTGAPDRIAYLLKHAQSASKG